MPSPWAKIEKPEPVDLTDIMSEQVAVNLQIREDEAAPKPKPPETTQDDLLLNYAGADLSQFTENDCSNDELIARMLEADDRDEEVRLREKHMNRNSKVSVSFENFFSSPHKPAEEVEEAENNKDWDRFERNQRERESIPACGYKVNSDGTVVTKHDVVIAGRNNVCKMLSFPPEFHTGDGEDFDMKLPNKVYNSLKMHSNKETSRRQRHQDKKDKATSDFSMDEETRILLHKLINNRDLEKVIGTINEGKEGLVLRGECLVDAESAAVEQCAVKVYNLTMTDFRRREIYIKDDRRFKSRYSKCIRSVIHLWAEKEFYNLKKIQLAGIPCPTPIKNKNHVLLMSFVGDKEAAPKLKDVSLKSEIWSKVYREVVDMMKVLYEVAGLIHADLSEYNILWHKDQCYLIDVGQAVEPRHENAYFFLRRDCNNITNFFQKKQLPNIYSADQLFEYIVGCSYNDREHLETLREKFKIKPHLMDRPDVELANHFESHWDRSQEQFPASDALVSEVDQISMIEPPKA